MHILIFSLLFGVVLGSLLLTVLAWFALNKKKLSLITGIVPLFLITVTFFHLNSDAGEARTTQFNTLAQEYHGFVEEVGCTSEDGLSMYEYWLSKDLIDLYEARYLNSLRLKAMANQS